MLFSVKEMEAGPVEMWGGRMKATSIQRARIVKGVERLIILNKGRYKTTTLDKSHLMNTKTHSIPTLIEKEIFQPK